jgi:hypothetical protein
MIHVDAAAEQQLWTCLRDAWLRVMLCVLDGYRSFMQSPLDTAAASPAASIQGSAHGSTVGVATPTALMLSPHTAVRSILGSGHSSEPAATSGRAAVAASKASGWYNTAGFVAAPKSDSLKALREKMTSTQSWQRCVDRPLRVWRDCCFPCGRVCVRVCR